MILFVIANDATLKLVHLLMINVCTACKNLTATLKLIQFLNDTYV